MDDAEAAERNQALKNPFPKPPSHWALYTNDNLQLLELLKRRLQAEKTITDAPFQVDQVALLHDEPSLPSFSLLELEPPRLDWIYEKGEYTTFGETHSVSQLGRIRVALLTMTQRPQIKRRHIRLTLNDLQS